MDWNRLKPWLGTLARLVLGVLWIWASLPKLHDPRQFVQAVRAYDVTWEWLSKAIGYGLPVVEFCVGVLLILGVVVRLAAIVSLGMLLMFLIGTIQAAARDLQISCGCFGGGGSTVAPTTYLLDSARDVGLLVLAAYLVVWSYTHISIEEYLQRHDYVEVPSAKRMRSEKGRRDYESAIRAKQAAASSRSQYMNISAGVLLAVITLATIGVQANRAKIAGTLTATNASVANGVVVGIPAAATVDIYEDFQCPNCMKFEQAVGPTLQNDVKANLAQVRYHTMSFLDSATGGNKYSSRAANAALCASDISVADFVAYHNVLFGFDTSRQQVQPKEGSSGRSDGDLSRYAQQIGLKAANLGTFQTCVQRQTHKALVSAITDKASQRGVNATPTVFVNGKQVALTLSALKAAIAAADAKGPAPTPQSSPSSSSSPSAPTTTVPVSSSSKPATSSSAKPSSSSSPKK